MESSEYEILSKLNMRVRKKKKTLTFFVVIDELGGTTQTDHLHCRTSKTQVSACPENLISC